MATNKNLGEVLVGVDGSEGAQRALEWALAKTSLLGTVRTVGTYTVSFPAGAPVLASAGYLDPSLYLESARARVEAVLDVVDPSLKDTNAMLEGSAGRVLVEASKEASMLVVGCRGRSVRTEMFLGSVGSYCVKHAQCPVVVVPDGVDPNGPFNRLVVGIDGSDNSKAALRWALDHVSPQGSILAMTAFPVILHAFDVQELPQQQLAAQSLGVLNTAVDEVATPLEREQLLELEVRPGDPRIELELALGSADALVVGARGHRGVAHLLLGSVTTSLTHQPAGVTVVVPDPDN